MHLELIMNNAAQKALNEINALWQKMENVHELLIVKTKFIIPIF